MGPGDLQLLEVFEDLEQQAAALHQQERDQQAEQVGRAEYAQVEVVARLHASLGRRLRIERIGADPLSGELARVGSDFCVLVAGRETRVLPLHAVAAISGLSHGAVAAPARPVQAGLSVRALLRRLAEGRDLLLVELGERSLRGGVGRVGRDFFELAEEGAGPTAPARVVLLEAMTGLRVLR